MQRAADVLQLDLAGPYAGAAAFRADPAMLVMTRMQAALFGAGAASDNARLQYASHHVFASCRSARSDCSGNGTDVGTVEA